MLAPPVAKRRFQLVLIKPSHYDDDGYVIQWRVSSIPANSLACVYALAREAADRQVLGPDVDFDITPIDEANTRIRPEQLIARLRAHDGFGMVGLVGVQSNQFPRAMDIARPLRAAGIPVVIGGFHVSGQLAMLPTLPADLQEALDLGCTLFAGEAEGRFDAVLEAAATRTLKAIYNYMNDLPGLEGAPVPLLPRDAIERVYESYSSFDAGRGCPFQCSFCTIINVQGRKSRRRSPDDVERLVRHHWDQGIRHFFITDDNFARNKDWEVIFDRLIVLRQRDSIDLRLIIQVDTGCHKIPNFIDKAAKAGVRKVFIGLENINPDNLLGAKKRQNKITEYRAMLQAWRRAGVLLYAGYIIGFPGDTPESVQRDIEIIKRELPIDILEFFCLTPLPGSEDHKALWQKGVPMDPDMNKYDLEHITTGHSRMTAAQWYETYSRAWTSYYSPEHMLTILRRSHALGTGSRYITVLFAFAAAMPLEGLHPLQIGWFRLKYRRDRRPGYPIEPVWQFYPKYGWEIASKYVRMTALALRLLRLLWQVRRERARAPYTDLALTPVSETETESLEMFTQNDAARNQVAHVRKVAALTSGKVTELHGA